MIWQKITKYRKIRVITFLNSVFKYSNVLKKKEFSSFISAKISPPEIAIYLLQIETIRKR